MPSSVLSPLELPYGDNGESGGYFTGLLIFPQAMDTDSTPPLSDFDMDGTDPPVGMVSRSWLSPTVLEIVTDSVYMPDDAYISYNGGDTPLQVADGSQAYGAFGPIDLHV
jgi:hypothetical protein